MHSVHLQEELPPNLFEMILRCGREKLRGDDGEHGSLGVRFVLLDFDVPEVRRSVSCCVGPDDILMKSL